MFFLAVILIPAQNKFGDKDYTLKERTGLAPGYIYTDFLCSDFLVKES